METGAQRVKGVYWLRLHAMGHGGGRGSPQHADQTLAHDKNRERVFPGHDSGSLQDISTLVTTFFTPDYLENHGTHDAETFVAGKISRSVDRRALSTVLCKVLLLEKIEFEKKVSRSDIPCKLRNGRRVQPTPVCIDRRPGNSDAHR